MDALQGCPRVDSNHHASRHRPSTCCVYHSATRANLDKLHMHITPILAICQRVESLFFSNTLQRARRQFGGISLVAKCWKYVYLKMLRGRYAETIQLGASTISLILRSTAAPQRQ